MTRNYCLALFMVACLAFSATRVAQAADEKKPAISPEHQAVAMELLEIMDMKKVLSDSIQTVLDMQLKQNPQIAQFKPIMLDFFSKYMSWDSLKDDMAAAYAQEFSQSELKEIISFYKTPTGKKLASKTSVLMGKGAELGQRRVQEHMGELQQAILAEIQKKGAKN